MKRERSTDGRDGPMILPMPAMQASRPYFVHRKTYDVGGMQLQHVSEWWDAGACPDPDAEAMPHRSDVVMTTRLWDPISGRTFRPVAPAPAAASR